VHFDQSLRYADHEQRLIEVACHVNPFAHSLAK
jgi:hypothetical protein